jgi:hypothetical protein
MSAAKQRGDAADPGDDRRCASKASSAEEKTRGSQHVNAGGDHGGGVDEGGDRRRAFHRVGQPDVQRNWADLPTAPQKMQEHGGGEVAVCA